MTKTVHDLDRSTAFTILLEVWDGYGDSPDDGGASITRFLADWREDPSLNMYEFACRWVKVVDADGTGW